MTLWKMKRTKADALFSLLVRIKDGWTCQRCFWFADPDNGEERRRIECSHFFKRANRRVRHDIENACALCTSCHMYLGDDKNRKEHEAFFLRRLGQAAYDRLVLRAHVADRAPDEQLIALGLKAEIRKLGWDPSTGKRIRQALSTFRPGRVA